jgi:hypothetical protein
VLICILLIAMTTFVVYGWRRSSPETRAGAARVVRRARLAAGADGLELIMRYMLDEMRESRVMGVHRFYVPNEMSFGVHPQDFARWGQYADRIADELAEMLLRDVKANHWTLAGDVELRVHIDQDEQARPSRPTFRAHIRKGCPKSVVKPNRPPIDPVAAKPRIISKTVRDPALAATVAMTTKWRLELHGLPPAPIGSELLIGRGRECGLRLRDPEVSGQHARLALMGGVVTLLDLSSTNGTFVNERAIENTTLKDGDEIRFGPSASGVLRARQ